ncbi:hypothetical protein [Candidatus Poriferisodalis sp.]|uniref:hypothetical protein n=1 Tax=Candidatus Poriferisodalis sp. TaxID=3101277 RepID=UPI003B5ABEA6
MVGGEPPDSRPGWVSDTLFPFESRFHRTSSGHQRHYIDEGSGEPIGLDFARKHPERVKNLVIANTWCWPVGSDRHFRFFSSMMSSRLGQYLITRRNYFVKGVMPRAVANRKTLTPEVMAHYLNAATSSPRRSRTRHCRWSGTC